MREDGQISVFAKRRTFQPPVVVRKYRMSGGREVHCHEQSELVCAADGVLTVQLETGTWVVPPQRAVWIPAGVEHRVTARRRCDVLALYADPGRIDVPDVGHMVALDPLTRELLRAAAAFEGAYEPGTPEERLIAVLLDRLSRVETRLVQVPQPVDERLQRLCALLETNPGDRRTLDELASEAGMSGRTATRLFRQEMQVTFAQWRQQVRLLAALELLGAGESVTRVSHAIGYRDVSAFIAMFRAAMGTSPGQYFAGNR